MVSEIDGVKRGRGRPIEENARRKTSCIRFDAEELDMLDRLETATGRNRSDIIRKALRGYYVYLKEVDMIDERK